MQPQTTPPGRFSSFGSLPQAPRRRSVHAGAESFEFTFAEPWPTRLNPHYHPEDEDASNDVWAARHGLDYPRLRQFRPLLLAAHTMPRTGAKGLRVGARFLSFLFAHDDLFVDHPEASGDELRALIGQYEAVLEGDLIARHPLAGMFMQVLWDLRDFPRDPWHFHAAVREYLAANVREVEGHGTELASVEDYRRERHHASAVVPVLELSMIVNGVELPGWIRGTELYARLVEDATMYICMYNDFVSLAKEIDCGDGHNILTVCMHSQELGSYAEAAEHVLNRHVRPLIARFGYNATVLLDRARRRSQADARAARGAVRIMRDWMGGHIRWEDTSHRHAST